MTILEIVMIIIGLGAVIVSFKVSDNISAPSSLGTNDEASSAKLDEKFDEAFSIYEEKISDKIEENLFLVDEKLVSMSEERIKGLDDYTKQVIDKIEKNHADVVFLYDMLNEKEKEIRELVHDADLTKADVRDELAKEYQEFKEYIDKISDIKKSLELETIQYKKAASSMNKTDNDTLIDASDIFGEDIYKKNLSEEILPEEILSDSTLPIEALSEGILPKEISAQSKDISLQEVLSEEVAGQNISDEVLLSFDNNIDNGNNISEIYDSDRTVVMDNNSLSGSPVNDYSTVNDSVNHNDEIIALYKKGRSILDISKMLGIGQGEVKFVIDMYEAS